MTNHKYEFKIKYIYIDIKTGTCRWIQASASEKIAENAARRSSPRIEKRPIVQNAKKTGEKERIRSNREPAKKRRPSVFRKRKANPERIDSTLRLKIMTEYNKLQPNPTANPANDLFFTLAQNFSLPKGLVSQIVREELAKAPLPGPMQNRIVSLYFSYVKRLERPPSGRRKSIAGTFQVPYRKVAAVVRDWKQKQPSVEDIPRSTRFEIEKEFFDLFPRGKAVDEITKQLAKRTGFTEWQIVRYLDLLHDGQKTLKNVPNVSPEIKFLVEGEYRNYLKQTSPPEQTLHDFLAQRANITHKQVHKVLLNYRLRLLDAHRRPGPASPNRSTPPTKAHLSP